MNTDNWREEHADDPIDKLLSQVTILDMFIAHIEMHDATKWYKGEYLGNRESDKKLANLLNDLVSATLKEKDKEIASLRAELEGLKEQIPGWISVEEGLPELFEGRYSERVLCLTNSGHRSVGYILNGEWFEDSRAVSFEMLGYAVTHWMPLPSAPSPQIKQG